MSVDVKELSAAAIGNIRRRYQEIFDRAMPHAGGIPADRIEVATFNLAATEAEFDGVGLGVETVVIFNDPSGGGHTGKVLMNLAGQLLPEHAHIDTYVLAKGTAVPADFDRLADVVNDFHGIRAYHSDGTVQMANGRPVYRFAAADYEIVQPSDGAQPLPPALADRLVHRFPGKSETFKPIFGDGVLFGDGIEVLTAPSDVDPHRLPDGLARLAAEVRANHPLTTTDMLYLTGGVSVLLPANTKHAFVAGQRGAVYLEFSTPSLDEADRFTDKRIIR